MEGFTVKWENKELTIHIQYYAWPLPKRLGLLALDAGGRPWGTISVNLPGEKCGPNEFFAKEYSENKDWVPHVLDEMMVKKLIKETGRTVASGHVDGIRQFVLI